MQFHHSWELLDFHQGSSGTPVGIGSLSVTQSKPLCLTQASQPGKYQQYYQHNLKNSVLALLYRYITVSVTLRRATHHQ
ncbi:hypothetical protein FRX31_012778 [Thalictrum thalictroides]|uniref:Uncharacterized protein n=1 Tax=Thalictrum thalictroides TaxID=46969 RepID=A0A7J6WNF6_THATH|nr:hypothetical protein FRX31_012778 [Thalictrum thalictroides]